MSRRGRNPVGPDGPTKPSRADEARVARVRIGLDEAGLGPTLGPLVVGGFATRERGAGEHDSLRDRMQAVIGEPGCRDGRIEVGDSKKIHTGSRKLARLERTALATIVWVHGELPSTVGELFERVLVREFEVEADRRAPWWGMLDEALPIVVDRDDVLAAGERLASAAERADVEALWYRADLVDAARVNRELDEEHEAGGTKNTWATHAVLRMAAQVHAEVEGRQLTIACDRAGGRQGYSRELRRAFPALIDPVAGQAGLFDSLGEAGALHVLGEARDVSRYRMSFSRREIELGFFVGGDRIDPRISWASILAKYLRELLLRPFNRYFAERVSGLRPTAGYPEDAKRFIDDVEQALGPDGGLERAAWVRAK